MQHLKLLANQMLDRCDLSPGEGAADFCELFLTIGVIGAELPIGGLFLLFRCLLCHSPGASRKVLCVGQVVLFEPTKRFDVKVCLLCFGESVVNESIYVSGGVLFKKRRGEGRLLL